MLVASITILLQPPLFPNHHSKVHAIDNLKYIFITTGIAKMPKKAVPEHHTLFNDSSSIYESSGDEQSDGLYDDSPRVVDEDFHQCYICGFAFYSQIYSDDRYVNDVSGHRYGSIRGGMYKAFKVENMDMYIRGSSWWWMPRRLSELSFSLPLSSQHTIQVNPRLVLKVK